MFTIVEYLVDVWNQYAAVDVVIDNSYGTIGSACLYDQLKHCYHYAQSLTIGTNIMLRSAVADKFHH